MAGGRLKSPYIDFGKTSESLLAKNMFASFMGYSILYSVTPD